MEQASLIEVKSGAEVIADMRAERQRTYRVRGRVVDSTGRPPERASISLNYTSLSGGGGGFGTGSGYDPATGAFELQNVIPGNYLVQAQVQDSILIQRPPDAATAMSRAAAVAAQPTAMLPIHVTNADIDGLVLIIKPRTSVEGRLIVDGGSVATLPNLGAIRVFFRPALNAMATMAGTPPIASGIAPDGTFRIDNVREGEFNMGLVGIPVGYYVKAARFDGRDVLGEALKFSDSASGALDVVLSDGAAQLSGTVTDARNLPVQGVQAVLVPSKRTHLDAYKYVVTDQSGRFTLAGVTPGDYKLFSWETLEPYQFLDPDFMKPFESLGRSIRINESATQSADVKVIPSAP
jgi:hypothetical protein